MLFKRDGRPHRGIEIPLGTPSPNAVVSRLLGQLYESPQQAHKAMFAVGFVLHCVLRRMQFDVIMIIEPGVARIVHRLRAWLPGAPRIVYTHGIGDGPEYYFWFCDDVIEVNNVNYALARDFAERSPRAPRLHLIPHFVLDPGESPDAISVEQARASFDLRTPNVLLHVGVICRDPKRVDYIVEEAARLPSNWSLLLAGDVADEDVLARGRALLGDRLRQVSLPREQMCRAYAAADVLVLASSNEGFGLVILEALMYGIPVLVPDRALFHWILRGSGNSVDMTVSGALSRRILEDVSDEQWQKVQRKLGRELLQEHYTWSAVRQAYRKLLCRDLPVR